MVADSLMLNTIVKNLGIMARDTSKRGKIKLIRGLAYAKMWADVNNNNFGYRIFARELRGVLSGNEHLVDDWLVLYAYIDNIGDRIEKAKEVADKLNKMSALNKAKALVLYRRLKLCNDVWYAIRKRKLMREIDELVRSDRTGDLLMAGLVVLYARLGAKSDSVFRAFLNRRREEIIRKLRARGVKNVILFRLSGETSDLPDKTMINKYYSWFVWKWNEEKKLESSW